MAEITNLNRPWLVAIWPGMGGVAINAGYYMVAKLDMRLLAEFSLQALFDLEYVEDRDAVYARFETREGECWITICIDNESMHFKTDLDRGDLILYQENLPWFGHGLLGLEPLHSSTAV